MYISCSCTLFVCRKFAKKANSPYLPIVLALFSLVLIKIKVVFATKKNELGMDYIEHVFGKDHPLCSSNVARGIWAVRVAFFVCENEKRFFIFLSNFTINCCRKAAGK